MSLTFATLNPDKFGKDGTVTIKGTCDYIQSITDTIARIELENLYFLTLPTPEDIDKITYFNNVRYIIKLQNDVKIITDVLKDKAYTV